MFFSDSAEYYHLAEKLCAVNKIYSWLSKSRSSPYRALLCSFKFVFYVGSIFTNAANMERLSLCCKDLALWPSSMLSSWYLRRPLHQKTSETQFLLACDMLRLPLPRIKCNKVTQKHWVLRTISLDFVIKVRWSLSCLLYALCLLC